MRFFALLVLLFFANASDMFRITPLAHDFPRWLIVIALVQAKVLRFCGSAVLPLLAVVAPPQWHQASLPEVGGRLRSLRQRRQITVRHLSRHVHKCVNKNAFLDTHFAPVTRVWADAAA